MVSDGLGVLCRSHIAGDYVRATTRLQSVRNEKSRIYSRSGMPEVSRVVHRRAERAAARGTGEVCVRRVSTVSHTGPNTRQRLAQDLLLICGHTRRRGDDKGKTSCYAPARVPLDLAAICWDEWHERGVAFLATCSGACE
jgi:hypothetical protein